MSLLAKQGQSKKDGLDDPELERDITKLLVSYLLNDAFFDILANFPILLYILINKGSPKGAEELEEYGEYNTYNFLMALKFLRLYHFSDVTDALKRLMNKLSDIF